MLLSYSSLRSNTKLTILSTLCITGKLEFISSCFSHLSSLFAPCALFDLFALCTLCGQSIHFPICPLLLIHFMHFFYRPQRSCEGYVFTGVCLSTRWVGVSASVHAGIPLPKSRHPQEADTPPRADTPQKQTPPQEQTPPQKQTPPKSRHPPKEADTPPPEIRPLLRTVRILLECILECAGFRHLS